MRHTPLRIQYRYRELFGEIIRILRYDFEGAHRAIRFLLDSKQVERVIIAGKIFYRVLSIPLELPIIRIEIVFNYISKKETKGYPTKFGEIRVFVYTLRPLKYGLRRDRYEIFFKEALEVEKLFPSFIDAMNKGIVKRDIGFEDTEISEKMFEEEKGVLDEMNALGIVRKEGVTYIYRIKKKEGKWEIVERIVQ